MKNNKLIIVAGGTGGHVLPGLEIAKYLIKKGWIIHWIGSSNKKIEAELVPLNGIKIDFLNISTINIKKIFSFFIKNIFFYKKAYSIIKLFKPDLILGMGSYVSGISCLAGWFQGIPIIIHEQNKIAGLSNRLISKISSKKLQAFSGALKHAETVGNPIRKEILCIKPPKERLKNRIGPIRILAIGGSQGSQILNNIIMKLVCILNQKIILWHQTGKKEQQKIIDYYKFINYKFYKVHDFIYDIHKAYNWTDIIICRSGALTVSEITAVGIPAIFFPYPHKDRQQYFNALSLKKNKAAKIFEEKDLKIEKIVKILNYWNRNKIKKIAQRSYSLSIRNSTEKIANILISQIINKK